MVLSRVHINPLTIKQRLQVDVLELAWDVIASDNKSCWVSNSLEQRSQQHNLVVTVSNAPMQCHDRSRNCFDAVDVSCVTNPVAHQLEKRMSLCELVFLRGQEYGSGRRLANVQVSAVLIDQAPHSAERLLDAAHTIGKRDNVAREPWCGGEHHARFVPRLARPCQLVRVADLKVVGLILVVDHRERQVAHPSQVFLMLLNLWGYLGELLKPVRQFHNLN